MDIDEQLAAFDMSEHDKRVIKAMFKKYSKLLHAIGRL